jgi:hypothetical protein
MFFQATIQLVEKSARDVSTLMVTKSVTLVGVMVKNNNQN